MRPRLIVSIAMAMGCAAEPAFDAARAVATDIAAVHRFAQWTVSLSDDARVSVSRDGASLALAPSIAVSRARRHQGSLIYAAGDGVEVVLTPIAEGVKEHVVLLRPQRDSLEMRWTWEAQGVSPHLDDDGAVVAGPLKIPAPVVTDAAGMPVAGVAHYRLEPGALTLVATGLSALKHPVDIDPTLLITDMSLPSDATLGDGARIQNGLVRAPISQGLAAWTSTRSMLIERQGACAVTHAGYVIAMGGMTSPGVVTATVESSPVVDSGAVVFARTTDLPAARSHGACAAWNGRVYYAGGEASGQPMDEVWVSRADSKGLLSPWALVTRLPAANARFALVAYRGFLYALGGAGPVSMSQSADVWRAAIRADGSLGPWVAAPSLQRTKNTLAAVAYLDQLYVLGGFSGANPVADVEVSRIGPDGQLGRFRTANPLPERRASGSAVVAHGHLYFAGGESMAGLSATVFSATVSGGGVGPWVQLTQSLPTARAEGALVHDGDFIAYVGGSGGQALKGMAMARLVDSPLQPFRVVGDLGTPRTDLGLVASRGRLIAIGGRTSLAVPTSSVEQVPILSDGGLSKSAPTSPLSGSARFWFGVSTDQERVYVFGGFSTPSTDEIQVATVESDGGLSSWQLAGRMPATRAGNAIAVHDGWAYSIGGAGSTQVQAYRINPLDGGVTFSGNTSTYPLPVNFPAAAAYGGAVYVSGGMAATTMPHVFAARALGDGGLSSWAAVQSLPNGVSNHQMLAHQGWLIVVGGERGGLPTDEVFLSPIGPDGGLGPWIAGPPLPQPRSGLSAAVWDGELYVAGGAPADGGVLTSIVAARLPARGTLGPWSRAQNFPNRRRASAVAVVADHAFLLGGNVNSQPSADVQVTMLGPDGVAGPFAAGPPLPRPLNDHSATVVDGCIFVAGGFIDGSGGTTNEVLSARPDGGDLGRWTPLTTPLPSSRASHDAVAWRGHLYVAGGNGLGMDFGDVSYAPVLANCQLGPFVVTQPLSFPRWRLTLLASGGYLYALGGSLGNDLSTSVVEFAAIGSSGDLVRWQNTTPLPIRARSHAAVARDGFIYVVGGNSGMSGTATSTALDEVWVAPIHGDGTLGRWVPTESLPLPRFTSSLAYHQGWLYLFGGATGAGAASNLNEVVTAQVFAPQARGRYTKWVGFPSAAAVDSITVASKGVGAGDLLLEYRVAKAENGGFGNWVDRGRVSSMQRVDTLEKEVRALEIQLTLDESVAASAALHRPNPLGIAEFTVDFTGGMGTGGGAAGGAGGGGASGGAGGNGNGGGSLGGGSVSPADAGQPLKPPVGFPCGCAVGSPVPLLAAALALLRRARVRRVTRNGIAALLASLALMGAAPAKNPYLAGAERLFVSLEYEEALRTLERAASVASNTPEDDTRIALFEGLCHAGLNRESKALRAFKRALALDPRATLPVEVPPKLEALFRRARLELKLPETPEPPPQPKPTEPVKSTEVSKAPPAELKTPEAVKSVPAEQATAATEPKVSDSPRAPGDGAPAAKVPSAQRPSTEPTKTALGSEADGPGASDVASAPSAPPSTEEPAATTFRLHLDADVLWDPLSKGVTGALGVGLGVSVLDVRLRLVPGVVFAGSVEASLQLLRDWRVSPRAGARLTVPFGAGFGGGPLLGVRVRLGAGFWLNFEAALELFSIRADFAPRALVLGAGLAFVPWQN